jgi:hypothetical protein
MTRNLIYNTISKSEQRNKQRQENVINCDCGGKYVSTLTHSKLNHENTVMHQYFIKYGIPKPKTHDYIECDICGGRYFQKDKQRHDNTYKHQKMLN